MIKGWALKQKTNWILMDRVNEVSLKYEIKINVVKTKVMVIFRQGGGVTNITLNGKYIKQVKFCY